MSCHSMLIGRFFSIFFPLLLLSKSCGGFADWMTKEYCSRTMNPGDVLMNADVFLSNDRTVRVFRGEDELFAQSNDSSLLFFYKAGESLSIRVSDSKPQYVFETTAPATFEGGGCEGLRLANKPTATLFIPDDASQNISIRVAWAPGHGTVNVSPYLILQPSVSLDLSNGLTASEVKEKEIHRKSLLKDIFVPRDELMPADTSQAQLKSSSDTFSSNNEERDRQRKKHRAQILRSKDKNMLRTRDHPNSKDSHSEPVELEQAHGSSTRVGKKGGNKDHHHKRPTSRHHEEEEGEPTIDMLLITNSNSQMYWDWLARVLMVLGGIFALTISCGSLMALWHSRFAIWRSVKRALGMDVTEE